MYFGSSIDPKVGEGGFIESLRQTQKDYKRQLIIKNQSKIPLKMEITPRKKYDTRTSLTQEEYDNIEKEKKLMKHTRSVS